MSAQVFETTVFNRRLAAEARMLFVPREVVEQLGLLPEPGTAAGDLRGQEVLGIRVGVPIPEQDGLVDVFYASLAGRVYRFDEGSFARWRPQWGSDQSEQREFAWDLAFGDRAPISNSPLHTESVASLMQRGEAYVVDGASWAFTHPLQSLGVFVVAQGGLLIVGVGRAVRETVVIAAKYHLRRVMGIPEDWLPPEDRD